MNIRLCLLAITVLIASVSSSGVIGQKSERVKALSRAVQNRLRPLAQQAPSQFPFVPITRSSPPAIASINRAFIPLSGSTQDQQPQLPPQQSAQPASASQREQQLLQQQIKQQQQLIQSAQQQQRNLVPPQQPMQQTQQPSVRQQNGGFCQNAQPGEIIAHPTNSNQFVICYGFGEFTVMACPAHLIYNAHLQRCDLHQDEPNMCASNPCHNNGKCVELGSSFRCECPSGFTGKTCEREDSCTTNPCGSTGFCLTTPQGSSLGHICLCNGGRSYGSTCQQTEPNPCLNPGSNFKMFASNLGNNVFAHCEGARPHFQFCQAPLVFSQSKQACDWQ